MVGINSKRFASEASSSGFPPIKIIGTAPAHVTCKATFNAPLAAEPTYRFSTSPYFLTTGPLKAGPLPITTTAAAICLYEPASSPEIPRRETPGRLLHTVTFKRRKQNRGHPPKNRISQRQTTRTP